MQTWQDKQVGVIGLGLLGSVLARRLIQRGWFVVGYDIDPNTERRFDEEPNGFRFAPPGEWLSECKKLILCLPKSEDCLKFVDDFQEMFDEELAIVDTTTGYPADSERLAEKLSRQNMTYMDATILGSSKLVKEGGHRMFVGANADRCRQHHGLLSALSENYVALGKPGSGNRMKLVANLVIGLHRAVLAEALTFADSLGISKQLALEILRDGAAASAAMEQKGQKMVERDYRPFAKLSQHRKDVDLILRLADEQAVSLPLSSEHFRLLQIAETAGLGDQDNTAIIEAWQYLDGNT